jgi:hypothetical protein
MFRKKRLRQLDNLITAFIVKNHTQLGVKYYQGFNDIISVFLLTLDCNMGFYCADIFARFYLIDFLTLRFDQGLIPLFNLASKVLRQVNEDLYMFITQGDT